MRHNRGRGAAIAMGPLTPGAVVVGIVAVVVLLGVVLAAREAGPIPIDERALLAGNEDTTPPVTAARAQPAPTPQTNDSEGLLSKISMWYVIVSWCALALVVVVVLRALIAMRDDEKDDAAPRPRPAASGVPSRGAREQLQRAAARAEDALLAAGPGTVDDAVIAAWMHLEQAATDAGTRRRPWATPTEFTLALLKRHDADPDAMSALLALYHQARFGGPPLPPAAADDALAAVRTIASGLGATRTGSR